MYGVIQKSYRNLSSTRGPTVVCQSRERCIIVLQFKSSKELYAFSEMFQPFWESALQKITGLNFNFNRALNWLHVCFSVVNSNLWSLNKFCILESLLSAFLCVKKITARSSTNQNPRAHTQFAHD